MMPQNMFQQTPYVQPVYTQSNAWAQPAPVTQSTPPAMFGKVITNPNEISPQDIPTDGNSCYFPMADKSCIYVKSWNPDCTMSTVRYVPETSVSMQQSVEQQSQESNTTPEPSVTDVLIEHLERIEKAIKEGYRKQVYGGKKNGAPPDHNTEDNKLFGR